MSGHYVLSAEQQQLQATLRDLLGGPGAARACYADGGTAPAGALWAHLAELGLTGLGVPEERGGSGGTVIDQVVAAEELGRAVAPVGLVPGAAAALALAGAQGGDADRLLAGLAAGSLRAGVVAGDPTVAYDCAGAEVLLVLDGDAVRVVEGATVEPLPSIDRTRPMATCSWEAGHEVALDGLAEAERVREVQRTLYAAEAVGVAAAALDMTASYTRDRRQFGLPIGTFQAVKHRLADMLVDVENARSAAYAAAWALADGAPASLAAHMAQAVATEAAVRVVSAAIQLHGGIGVTWEHDLHLYLRRAKALELACGTPGWHYDQIATALLGPVRGR